MPSRLALSLSPLLLAACVATVVPSRSTDFGTHASSDGPPSPNDATTLSTDDAIVPSDDAPTKVSDGAATPDDLAGPNLPVDAALANDLGNTIPSRDMAQAAPPDAVPFRDLQSTNLPVGSVCSSAAQCASGYCVEGVCCNQACAGGDPCNHCAVARGADTEGICTAAAELPRRRVDTGQLPAGLKARPLLDAEDLQTVLAASGPGVEIIVPAGRSFSSIELPARAPGTTQWTILRSAASGLPGPGQRIKKAQAALLPKLTSPDGGFALRTAAGASHYWIVGFEVRPAVSPTKIDALVRIGDGSAATPAADHIVLDRMLIHGDPDWGSEVASAVTAQGDTIAVINSRISEIHTLYRADQCTGGCKEAVGFVTWSGPGPYKIANNYIAAGTHNMIFGGEVSPSPALEPQDIEIVHNHLYKPPSWYVADRAPRWQAKDIIEAKTGWRILIEGNYLENEWNSTGTSNAPQVGHAIVFSPRNGDTATTSPWSSIRDVTVRNNKLVNASRGIGITAQDSRSGVMSGQTQCVVIANNLFDKLPGSMPGDGRLVTMNSGPTVGNADVRFEHNTALHQGSILSFGSLGASIVPNSGAIFRNNLWLAGGGIEGDGAGVGSGALQAYFSAGEFRRNDMIGGNAAPYGACTDYNNPACTFFSANPAVVQFTNLAQSDYRLTPGSPDNGQCSHRFGGTPHPLGVRDWSASGLGQADAARDATDLDP